MDNKFLRTLIYVFSGLIVVFTLLILLNYFGSLAGRRADLPGQENSGKKAAGAEALAQEALAAAKYSGGARGSMIPSFRQGLSSAAVKTEGAIMLVKERSFGGVAEKPKDMLEVLNDLSGGNKGKPAPIALKDADLDKKITVGGEPGKEPRLASSSMPELGRGPAQEGITLLNAPVDYKIFKSSETWWAFAGSRKCRSNPEAWGGLKQAVSPLSGPDFAKESVIVLVSVSELPNGIFKIMTVEKTGKELRLDYRVDPLAMAAGDDDQHDFYSAAVIPGGLPVKLRQVP
ncbi:MAG: hypothetical protein A2X35_12010 [Elusimicrobia bacterium GWA2_61_42]|nr:MAG: hypothetical protein A2X35_12010 [Elusimicrobia bacterium GWA2_61_42]OGR76372.1 MAG: hypothetical protein A2X38_01180 [Elusimicrobia bacterium GWC2_61_25]